jgi:hypothetical protein
MKLSVIKRILVESFPSDVQKWVPAIVQPLNSFMDQVAKALSSGLTVRDNLKTQVYTITLSASQTYPLTVSYDLNEKPLELRVARIASQDGSALPVHSFTWTWKGNQLDMTFNGLSAVKYDVILIAQV